MRAVGITAPGNYDVLSVIDRPVREPGAAEVRIAVRAAAVNPTDSGLRTRGGGELPAPWTPGMDAAGTIESLGEGVERLHVGERVMAAVSPRRPEGGAQAALLLAPAASVVPIPEGATLEQASTLPMNGLTARLGLEMLGLQPGQTLADDAAFGAIRNGGAMIVVRGWQPQETERGIEVKPVMVSTALERTDWLEELRLLASEGRLQLRVAGEYTPEQAAEAERVTDAGGLRGRAVIVF